MHSNENVPAAVMIQELSGPLLEIAPKAIAFELPNHVGFSSMIELPLGTSGPWYAWTQFWDSPDVPAAGLPDVTIAVTGSNEEDRVNMRRNLHADRDGATIDGTVAISALINGQDVPLSTVRTPSGGLISEVDRDGLLLIVVQRQPYVTECQIRPVLDGLGYAERSLQWMRAATEA